MDEPLMGGAMKTARQCLALLLGLLLAPSVLADSLSDPTQPPAELQPESAGGVATSGPVLQSVVLSSGRKAAMISGQMVRVGEKFGDARLVRLSDREAVLRAADGTEQILNMYPGVEKKLKRPVTGHVTKRPVKDTR